MSKNAYAIELQKKKALERHVARQMVADAAVIAANQVFGAGEKRCAEFMETLRSVMDEISQLIYGDTPDIEYSQTVIDRRLREILKDHFEPWDERYSL